MRILEPFFFVMSLPGHALCATLKVINDIVPEREVSEVYKNKDVSHRRNIHGERNERAK